MVLIPPVVGLLAFLHLLQRPPVVVAEAEVAQPPEVPEAEVAQPPEAEVPEAEEEEDLLLLLLPQPRALQERQAQPALVQIAKLANTRTSREMVPALVAARASILMQSKPPVFLLG